MGAGVNDLFDAVTVTAPSTQPISGDDLLRRHFDDGRRLLRHGRWVLLLGVLPVLGWMALAPLSAAVVAQGYVKVDQNRRTVQHAEGGIVRAVHVRDGQKVRRGEPLLELGDVSVAADQQRLRARLLFEFASVVRLEAEQARQSGLRWPRELSEAATKDKVLAEQMRKEDGLFNARRQALSSQTQLLREQRAKVAQEVESLRQQISQAETSIAAQRRELETNRKLVKDGYIAPTRIMQLEATVADYGVKLEERRSEVIRAEQRMVDIDLKLRGFDNDYRQQASDQLKAANVRVSDIEQELRKATDVASRQMITAPVDGEVMGLRYMTAGAVIAPREPVLDVVPADPTLLVDARIRTDDINRVHVGQPAHLRFTAYKYRTTQMVPGKVTYVSADRMVDKDANQAAYYTVHVAVDQNHPDMPSLEQKLQAGMSAEVYLEGDERTPLRYLMEPVTQVLRHAGRER